MHAHVFVSTGLLVKAQALLMLSSIRCLPKRRQPPILLAAHSIVAMEVECFDALVTLVFVGEHGIVAIVAVGLEVHRGKMLMLRSPYKTREFGAEMCRRHCSEDASRKWPSRTMCGWFSAAVEMILHS